LVYLLDTSIAIHLRDDTAGIADRLANCTSPAVLSAISRVELEGGVAAIRSLSSLRRAKLDVLLETLEVIDFTNDMAKAYGRIAEQTGFSRRKALDRMIAATALVTGMTLVTTNPGDFADIDGLKLEVWNP
jgi:predicted nucleic acid-binding protein